MEHAQEFVGAAEEGEIEDVTYFCKVGVDVNAQVGYVSCCCCSNEPMCWFCLSAILYMFTHLLPPCQTKSRFFHTLKHKWTALIRAADNGHLGIVRELLARDADPNIQNKVRDGCMRVCNCGGSQPSCTKSPTDLRMSFHFKSTSGVRHECTCSYVHVHLFLLPLVSQKHARLPVPLYLGNQRRYIILQPLPDPGKHI